MGAYSKESLEKLLLLIDEICDEKEYLWFKVELIKKFSEASQTLSGLNDLHRDLKRTKSFLKYIDGQYWREGFNFYKKISDSNLKIALTSDFKEMKIAENENNLLEFVRRLILQLENILNHLILKFDAYNIISSNPKAYIGENFNLVMGQYSFFNDDGKNKPLKSISLPSKLTWVKIYFNINYTWSTWRNLTFIRNKASHREALIGDERIKMEELESNWNTNKMEYDKFFNSLAKQLISHI